MNPSPARTRPPRARSRSGGRALSTVLTALLTVALASVGLVGVASPSSAEDSTLTFVGRGWGHGRGMGQYGALGYAVDYGWNFRQIVDHFYAPTTLQGGTPNSTMRVELTALTGAPLIVTAPGLSVNGVPLGRGVVQIARNASTGAFYILTSDSCGGPFTQWGEMPSGVTLRSAEDPTNLDSFLRVCQSSITRGYRGAISMVSAGGTSYAINELPVEDYLRGVVPRESPASWGDLGGGRGLQALSAQAIAARSYALAGSARTSGAQTCDTTACQVYLGAYEWPYSGVRKPLEDYRSDRAIRETAGQVMRTAAGAIARTEFSSSTGGWTTGTSFTNVEDLGDATSLNPNRGWAKGLTVSAVSSALGVGQIASIAVTGRNGLGPDGGRVTEVTVRATDGRVTALSGATVRARLGLNSDWFSISGTTPGQASAVVKALYQDVLGRAPDAAGLAGWTNQLLVTGNPQVVTNGIVYSPERIATLIAAEYRGALHREPEAGGLQNWRLYLERGAGVSDLQVGVYSSQESLNVLGGGDTRTWVGGMYAAILGRPASDSEQSMWADVAFRSGRVTAVTGIAKSSEAGLRRLDAYYQTYLGRSLDPAGASVWLPYMSGAGDFQVPGLIGGSPEYWARAQVRYP
ncbi:SpoIID/LytB domain-containing protein [Pengzhenrongella frigida]|uniref:SpoIID/LytB domain-containing protein n=1 Tax=Pengzhenrongella frigida TaxID=1259133 RepID=A0A4Q5N3Z7_9MICO|nr:SpoIID/LytB domain-containing protein [Cellulomonas sp. HLT2-17]RYV51367.1 SpoIID/LytB domain-containing protein [Cellulomonas sp. HLT2-17]